MKPIWSFDVGFDLFTLRAKVQCDKSSIIKLQKQLLNSGYCKNSKIHCNEWCVEHEVLHINWVSETQISYLMSDDYIGEIVLK